MRFLTKKKTAVYRVVNEETGNRYEFFCDLSYAHLYTTETYNEDDPQKELMLAWNNEASVHFNQCRKCGKWISDVMFNPDVLNCVKCTPIEEYPDFCPECGAKTNNTAYFCHMCGTRLLYGGEAENEKTVYE